MNIDDLLCSCYPEPTHLTIENRLAKFSMHYRETVLDVEYAFWRWKLGTDTDEIWTVLTKPLREKAQRLGYKHRNRRLDAADFEEALWLATWYTLKRFNPKKGFLVYETLRQTWKRRCQNVVKGTKKDKRRLLHEAVSLDEKLANGHTPKKFADPRQNVEQMVTGFSWNTDTLTDAEAMLLEVMLADPHGTDGDWAGRLSALSGTDYKRRNVGKMRDRLRSKLVTARQAG